MALAVEVAVRTARKEHEFRIIVALGLIGAGVLFVVMLWLCVDYGKHQTCSEVGGTYRRSTFGGTCTRPPATLSPHDRARLADVLRFTAGWLDKIKLVVDRQGGPKDAREAAIFTHAQHNAAEAKRLLEILEPGARP